MVNENTLTMNFETNEYVIFVKSTKIGTNKSKAIHSKWQISTFLARLHFSAEELLLYPLRRRLCRCRHPHAKC